MNHVYQGRVTKNENLPHEHGYGKTSSIFQVTIHPAAGKG